MTGLERVVMNTSNQVNILGYKEEDVTRHAEAVKEFITFENAAISGNFDIKWKVDNEVKPESLVIFYNSAQTISTTLTLRLTNITNTLTYFTINFNVNTLVNSNVFIYNFPCLALPLNRLLQLSGDGQITSIILTCKRIKILERLTSNTLD